jgi:hypothetical protein
MIMKAGGCLYGAIRYQISAEPRSADYCHCSMCRRAAEARVVARLTVANESFAWTTGQPAVYRSSPKAERLFCPKCGTQLALHDEPDYLDVTLASLDTPETVRPSYHIWTASRIGWFEIADDLPRYPESSRAEVQISAATAISHRASPSFGLRGDKLPGSVQRI